MKKLLELIKKETEENWKYTNKKYLFELQKFLDIAENIEDEYLQTIVKNVIKALQLLQKKCLKI